MGEQNGIDAGSVHRQRIPVVKPQLLEPLEKAAVDQDAAAIGLQQVF